MAADFGANNLQWLSIIRGLVRRIN